MLRNVIVQQLHLVPYGVCFPFSSILNRNTGIECAFVDVFG